MARFLHGLGVLQHQNSDGMGYLCSCRISNIKVPPIQRAQTQCSLHSVVETRLQLKAVGGSGFPRYPSSTLLPFLFGVSLLKQNSRKKGTLVI